METNLLEKLLLIKLLEVWEESKDYYLIFLLFTQIMVSYIEDILSPNWKNFAHHISKEDNHFQKLVIGFL